MSTLLIALASIVLSAAGESRLLETCVPGDAMAAYFVRPAPEMLNAPPGGVVDRFARGIITLKAMGLIPRDAQVIADIAATIPMLGRRPHAMVLLDITSKQLAPGSYRLNDMQSALIIDTEGMEASFDRRLRDVLVTYTSTDSSKIEPQTIGQVNYHRLTDDRLEGWAVIEWGTIGKHLLVTFGRGAFEKMLDTLQGRKASLAKDAWYSAAHERCHGATSGLEVFVDIARIKARLGEVVQTQPAEVLQALNLQEADRLVWTVGFEGRAMRSEIVGRDNKGADHYAKLIGEDIASPEVIAAIPPGASSYAAFRFDLADFFRNARRAYLKGRSPSARDRLRSGWARLEQEFDFDLETGLLDQLGSHLVVHTYPPHPMGLPLFWTIWIETTGDQATVQRTVDAMLAAWQQQLAGPSTTGPAGTRPATGLSPRIHQGPDGIWYMQLGILGPAVGVTDGWIVTSFSPQAVRQNLEHLKQVRHNNQP